MQKIEVVVRITKDYCPPQEQTIFEWIETNRAAPDTLNYPGLEINLEHRRVFKNGQEVYMSRYEYGVLSLMARHPGQLFTKEQIFEAVWHQEYRKKILGGGKMQSFEDVLREFGDFLQTASYLEVLPCRWGYVRLFNEGAPINFYAVLCRTPQELYDTLENDLAIEKEVQNPQRD